MDGDLDGKAAQGAAGEGHEGEQALSQGHQDAQEDGAQEVTGGEGGTDYQAALRAKDARIAELEGKVASAAKTAEATEALNAEIAALKQQMSDECVEFALKAAGARSIKAAKALLEEHDGDVAALVAAEPWLFEGAEAASQCTSQTSAGGATGLEPAGVAGGGDSAYMRRWERIAGLTDEKE
jgi:NACalpha-BTF3-like transcription factor